MTTSTEATQRTRLNVVLAACCFGQFMVILDGSVFNVALPVIQAEFSFRSNSLLWVANSYAIVYAGFLLLGGRLADFFGRRRLFLIGIVMFTLASMLAGLAFNAASLIVARGLQGLGAAVMAPATLTVLGTTFTEPGQRAKAFGLWGAAAGGGGAVGVLLGGLFTEWLSWRWLLLINLPIGVALFAAAAYAVAESRAGNGTRKLDLPGSVSITIGLIALVYGIAESEQHGWAATRVVVALTAAVALIGFFLFDQAKLAPQPLVPLDFFKRRSVSVANLVAVIASAAIFSVFYFFTLHMQQVLGYSPVETGLVYIPLSIGIFVGARGLSPYVGAIGPKRTLLIGLTISLLGMVWMSRASTDATFLADLLGPALLLGVGQGIVTTGTAMSATADLPHHQAGLASGVLNTTRQLGGAVGLTVLVALSTARTNALLASGADPLDALSAGYMLAFTVGSAFLLLAMVPALFATRSSSRPRPRPRQTN
ncbi:MAG TPA: MFS transporter [Candidatus Limnocylindrales bacterium]